MWDRDKLRALAKERREGLANVQQALLAFARVKEMSDEEVDRKDAERQLAEALDKLEPEALDRLTALGSAQRDEVLGDFLLALTDHNQQRIERDMADVMAMKPQRQPDPDDDDDDAPSRKRGRGR